MQKKNYIWKLLRHCTWLQSYYCSSVQTLLGWMAHIYLVTKPVWDELTRHSWDSSSCGLCTIIASRCVGFLRGCQSSALGNQNAWTSFHIKMNGSSLWFEHKQAAAGPREVRIERTEFGVQVLATWTKLCIQGHQVKCLCFSTSGTFTSQTSALEICHCATSSCYRCLFCLKSSVLKRAL